MKNHKTSLKKIKEDLNQWKDISCPWIERLHAEMAAPPTATHKVNAIPSKIPAAFFCRNGQADPKIHIGAQGAQTASTNLKKDEDAGLTVAGHGADREAPTCRAGRCSGGYRRAERRRAL